MGMRTSRKAYDSHLEVCSPSEGVNTLRDKTEQEKDEDGKAIAKILKSIRI